MDATSTCLPCQIEAEHSPATHVRSFPSDAFNRSRANFNAARVSHVPQWSIADPRRKLATTIEHLIGPDMQPLLLGAVDAVWTLLLGILHVI